MKRLLMALGFMTLSVTAYAGQGVSGSLTVSSGTFKAIQGFNNNSGGFVQAVAVADSSYTISAPVDPVIGLTVNLATSSANGIGSISNTSFASTQSGAWSVSPGTGTYPISDNGGSITVDGTVAATQSGAWSVSVGTGVYPVAVQGTAGISGTVTANQGTPGTVDWPVRVATTTVNQGTAGTSAWKVDFSTGVQVNQGTAGTSAWKVDLSTGVSQNGAWSVSVGTGIYPVAVQGTVNVVGTSGGGIIQQLVGTSTNSVGYANIITSVPVSIQGTPTVNSAQSGAWSVSVGTGIWPVAVQGSISSTPGPITQLVGTSTATIGFSNVITSVPVAIQGGSISNTSFGATQGAAGTSGWKVDFSTGVLVNQGTPGTVDWPVKVATTTVLQGAAGTSGWKVDFSTGVQSHQGTAGTSAWKIDSSTGLLTTQGAAGTSGWKVDFSTGVQARNSLLVSSNTAVPSAVADAGQVQAMGDKYGRLITMPMAPWGLVRVATATLTTNTAETIFLSSTSANTYYRIIGCIGQNSSATAAAITFRMDGGPSQINSGSFKLGMSASNVPVGFFPPGGIQQTKTAVAVTIQGSASVSSLDLTCWYVTE